MQKLLYVIAVLIFVVAAILSSIFIVDEREKVLVVQLGDIKVIRDEPGLGFKIPLIQEVVRYDDRILSFDTDEIEITFSDKRRLRVDAFSRYRIADSKLFHLAVGGGGLGAEEKLAAAEDRLESILNSQIRAVLGAESVTSNTILSPERRQLMNRIRDQARVRAAPMGLEVVDVRLKTTNLPKVNEDATFERMRAEREREAADEIARGNEAAQRVRAQADRTVIELVSAANRDADVIRGEADARRNEIFADAFKKDQEFFEFYRSLTAYTRSLKGSNSTMVITPDSEFFDYLYSPTPEANAEQ